MADQNPAADEAEENPYDAVRSFVIGRRFSEPDLPRAQWFVALAQAGLTGCLTGNPYRTGLRRMLRAAEVFGGCGPPLSFAPAAAAAAALAATDNPAAGKLLAEMLGGGAPVLPALQGGGNAQAMGARKGLEARRRAGQVWHVSGLRIGVPDAEHAQAFLAEAEGPDGLVVFVFRPGAAGVAQSSDKMAACGDAGSFHFDDAPIAADCVLAEGQAADALIDRMRFAVQLGLGAELAGMGAALITRAGAALVSEAALADALMDVTLARAFVFGLAAIAEPCRPDALELIAGARAYASNAALRAARLALESVEQPETIAPLARRALVAANIYRPPQAHMKRFAGWRLAMTPERDQHVRRDLFAAVAAFAGSGAQSTPSAALAATMAECDKVRALAVQSGMADDVVFRDRLGQAELDLFALICTDAQQHRVGDTTPRFVDAAVRRLRSRLADCALHAAGSAAAIGDGAHDLTNWFIRAHAL